MPSAWIVPTWDHLTKVIATAVQAKANENVGTEVTPEAAYDPDSADRKEELLNLVIAEFRGAIIAGGRIPLSQTLGSVPPECVVHVLSATAYRLVTSTPNLQAVLMSEGGLYAPLAQLYADARHMLKELAAGRVVTMPLDPEDEEGLVPDHGNADQIEGEYDMRTYV